jgi:hypothetical protein
MEMIPVGVTLYPSIQASDWVRRDHLQTIRKRQQVANHGSYQVAFMGVRSSDF